MIEKKVEQEEKKDERHQVKQVNNKKLLSFADDDDDDDGLNAPVVSYQQSQGVVSKEELKREIKMEKKTESAWVQKMKSKLLQKEKA